MEELRDKSYFSPLYTPLGLEYYQAYLESDCIDLSRNFIVDSKVVAKIWIAKEKRKKVSFLIMEVSQ